MRNTRQTSAITHTRKYSRRTVERANARQMCRNVTVLWGRMKQGGARWPPRSCQEHFSGNLALQHLATLATAMRCKSCGLSHSPAIGCKQALSLSGNSLGNSGNSNGDRQVRALTRCGVCRRLHEPHCVQKAAAGVQAKALAVCKSGGAPEPTAGRDGMGYDWADLVDERPADAREQPAQATHDVLALEYRPPVKAPPKVREPKPPKPAKPPRPPKDPKPPRPPKPKKEPKPRVTRPPKPPKPPKSLQKHGKTPHNRVTDAFVGPPKPRKPAATNAQRQAAWRARHAEAARALDKQRKEAARAARKGKTA